MRSLTSLLLLAAAASAAHAQTYSKVQFPRTNLGCPTAGYDDCLSVYLCIDSAAGQIQGTWSNFGVFMGTYDSGTRVAQVTAWPMHGSSQSGITLTFNNADLNSVSCTGNTDGCQLILGSTSASPVSGTASATIDLYAQCAWAQRGAGASSATLTGYYTDSSVAAEYYCVNSTSSSITGSYTFEYDAETAALYPGEVKTGDIELGRFSGALQDTAQSGERFWLGTWQAFSGPFIPLDGFQLQKFDPASGTLVGFYCELESLMQVSACYASVYAQQTSARNEAACSSFPQRNGITTLRIPKATTSCPSDWGSSFPACGQAVHCVDHSTHSVQGVSGQTLAFKGSFVSSSDRQATVTWWDNQGRTGVATWSYTSDFGNVVAGSVSGMPSGHSGYGSAVEGDVDIASDCLWTNRTVVGGATLEGQWIEANPSIRQINCLGGADGSAAGLLNGTYATFAANALGFSTQARTGAVSGLRVFDSDRGYAGRWERVTPSSAWGYELQVVDAALGTMRGWTCDWDASAGVATGCYQLAYVTSLPSSVYSRSYSACLSYPSSFLAGSAVDLPQPEEEDHKATVTALAAVVAVVAVAALLFAALWCSSRGKARAPGVGGGTVAQRTPLPPVALNAMVTDSPAKV